jgi:hypothetical protein
MYLLKVTRQLLHLLFKNDRTHMTNFRSFVFKSVAADSLQVHQREKKTVYEVASAVVCRCEYIFLLSQHTLCNVNCVFVCTMMPVSDIIVWSAVKAKCLVGTELNIKERSKQGPAIGIVISNNIVLVKKMDLSIGTKMFGWILKMVFYYIFSSNTQNNIAYYLCFKQQQTIFNGLIHFSLAGFEPSILYLDGSKFVT